MKKIFRKNQVIITALAIMIAVAGYLNFTKDNVDPNLVANDLNMATEDVFKESGEEDITYDDAADDTIMDISEEDIKGDDLAKVDEEGALEVSDSGDLAAATDPEETESATKEEETPGEAVLVNSSISSGFFSSAKISREQTRAKNKELLMEIVDNVNITGEQKQDAIDDVLEITAIAEKENAAEISLGAIGFENAVVSMVDGKVDVYVDNNTLTDQQLAQIENAVKTKTGVTVDKIAITPTNVKTE